MEEKYNRMLPADLDEEIKSRIHKDVEDQLAPHASKNKEGCRKEKRIQISIP